MKADLLQQVSLHEVSLITDRQPDGDGEMPT